MSENHQSVILCVYRYLALLRSSELPEWHQQELHELSTIRFRFLEKTRNPVDYAVWVTRYMLWPIPMELLLSAPGSKAEWDDEGCEKKVREILDIMTLDKGRVFLIAKADEHAKVSPNDNDKWEEEPWYGTKYKVEKFSQDFIEKVNSTSTLII